MAKQGNRDRPNPRHCPSNKLDNVMAASILGFHQGQRSPTAPQGRIDDCKPKVRSASLSQLAMQGASIDDKAPEFATDPFDSANPTIWLPAQSIISRISLPGVSMGWKM